MGFCHMERHMSLINNPKAKLMAEMLDFTKDSNLSFVKMSTLNAPVTKHYKAHKLWARECDLKQGSIIVGALYKKSHLLTVSKGHLAIDFDGSLIHLIAPTTIEVKSGTQKAILAIEDSIATAYFGTEAESIDDVIREFTTASPQDVLNQSLLIAK